MFSNSELDTHSIDMYTIFDAVYQFEICLHDLDMRYILS